MGATVTAIAPGLCLTDILRRLEHHTEVMVMNTSFNPERGIYVLTLRSLDFPEQWEGKQLTLRPSANGPGFEPFGPVIREST